MVAYPAQNTLWFWFDQATRRALHGTLEDAARKLEVFAVRQFPLQGFEIFLMPSRLSDEPVDAPFLARYLALPHRSVHIGETEARFLLHPDAPVRLRRLATILETLHCNAVIIHAHHFMEGGDRAADTLLESLPGIEVRIENNGFDNPWGARPETLSALFEAHPEFGLCLDIAHVDDFDDLGLKDFTSDDLLMNRLREVHFSYSTRKHALDPYIERGYPGYGPFHALFAVLDQTPDEAVAPLLGRVPVVVEGIVPREDAALTFLARELSLARGGST